MKARHSFEISESDNPVMQPRIPKERNPHEFNVVHFPCIYITYVKFNTILLYSAFYLLINSLSLLVSALRWLSSGSSYVSSVRNFASTYVVGILHEYNNNSNNNNNNRYILYAGYLHYIPETNHIHREQCVATILMLLFMVRRSLVPALTPSLR
jgi:hypothetical protein